MNTPLEGYKYTDDQELRESDPECALIDQK
jgi:hypothetical protein